MYGKKQYHNRDISLCVVFVFVQKMKSFIMFFKEKYFIRSISLEIKQFQIFCVFMLNS